MNKKVMLIPILALLLLSVPAAMAGSIQISGDGDYSQTTEFSDVSDYVELTGEWVFESNWGDSSGPDIDNIVTLYAGATFSEHAVSPRGYRYGEGYFYYSGTLQERMDAEAANPGLDLLTVVNCPASNIQDRAEIQVRGYDFTFDVTACAYTSTKDLKIYDSYNSLNLVPQPQDITYMDKATFTVIDTTTVNAYVVGGNIAYEERSYNQYIHYYVYNRLYLQQTFTQGSDTSSITSRHTTPDWFRPTAFFGEGTIAGDAIVFDWYAEVTEDAHTTDIFYASFVEDEAHIWLLYGKPLVPTDPVNSITLDAYSNVGDFSAYGSALDVDLWEFTGTDLHRADGTTQYLNVPGYAPEGWTTDLDMELGP